MISQASIKNLSKKLPHGSIQKIFERLEKNKIDTSYAEVAAVLSCKYYREYVLTEAFLYLKEIQNKEKDSDAKLNKLSKEIL